MHQRVLKSAQVSSLVVWGFEDSVHVSSVCVRYLSFSRIAPSTDLSDLFPWLFLLVHRRLTANFWGFLEVEEDRFPSLISFLFYWVVLFVWAFAVV